MTGNENNDGLIPSNACFYINVNTFVVSSAPSLNVGRFMHALVLLPNGIVLAIGGSSASGQALSSIEMFDTFAGYWTSVAASLGTAFLGAHTSNLAAISAALCTGPDAHPDPAQRWKAGPFYAFFWFLIALFGASLVGLFGALPPALLATVAGTALLGSLAGATGTALAADKDRFAAAGTLAVTASGVTLRGVGSAFWGLCSGLLVLAVERFFRR